jgi:hypothetical protein
LKKGHDVKRILGWLILLALLGAMIAATAIAHGWTVAAAALGCGIVFAALMLLVDEWIVD